MKYETWKQYLETKQRLSKLIHTSSPLEKEILKANLEVLETKVMSAPDSYWINLVKEYKK